MKKLILAFAVLATSIYAGEESLEVTPVIKSEVISSIALEDGARPAVFFGSQDFGVIVNKGDVEVAGVVSLVDAPDYGVSLNKVYVKKGIGESFDITAGYKNLPYGHWTSNCVNYPLVRSGNSNPTYDAYKIKQKASQVEVGYTGSVLVADVAGYVGSNGEFGSVAAKLSADLTILAPTVSVRADNMDSVDMTVGADVDFGVINFYGAYSRGVNVDRMGSYFEVSVFPTSFLITSLRADLLADTDTKDGITNFSLSNLFLLTDNVYAGLEYNIQSDVIDSDLQSAVHGLTAIIGCEF